MNMNAMKKVLFWLPRLLTIAFILFVSLFALDSFSDDKAFWQQIADFGMHLLPSILLTVVLVIAWKWEWFGTLVYFLLALIYIYLTWGKGQLSWILFISGPLVLISILFLINWVVKKNVMDPKQRL